MSSSQSPVRNRKAQIPSSTQVPMQNNIVPREASPSPSFRERQRAIKAHSMPLVPSVSQILAANNVQQTMSQPSPTGSNGSLPARRSPPTTSRISPAAAKLPSAHMSPNSRGERTPDRVGSPPPLLHSQSTPVVSQITNTQPQIGMLAAQPRPVPRVAPPQFLSQYQLGEGWHVTEELLAEIERADQQQGQLQGTSGVAYAGGAASNSSLHLQHSVATVKDPAVERVRATDRSSPKEVDNGLKRPVREKERDSPKTRERSQTTSSTSSQHTDSQSLAQRTPEYRGSPPFHTPMASPSERTAGYAQYIPDSYQQQQAQGPAQTLPRKPVPVLAPEASPLRSSPPGAQKISNQSQPSQSVNTRTTDRALPLQEEQEEEIGHEFPEVGAEYDERHHGSPTPSSDVYPDGHNTRYDDRREHGSNRSESDDETLNEEVQEKLQQKSEGEESSGFTPRSPTTNLPDRPNPAQYSPSLPNTQYTPSSHVPYPQAANDNQKTLRAKYRVASTDQLGMRNIDPMLFDQNGNGTNKSNGSNSSHGRTHSLPDQSFPDHYQKSATEPPPSRVDPQAYAAYSNSLPPHIEDLQGLYDVPTSSYLQQFFHLPNNRPNAPIPPTPLTHTAAPSPSPLSAMPSDIEPRQVGSPYPYPFTHIRRTALSAAQHAPSTTFDPNNPDVIREQLALQMQIYALNNGLAPPSDSTFSPSSTPYPPPSYNPWAVLHQAARPGDSNMSMRSSPSHEPIPIPMPPHLRGRGLRRRDNASNLRAPVARRRVKPPPRVESTQPRDTSPEPSSGSGEETAGEEQFVDQYVPQNGNGNGAWNNGEVHDDSDTLEDGEWIDEEEDEEEDLLQLEYHPAFINSVAKRRRRWETRWDALTQAFQALDRETDATLVVLAAPSHSTKLHALTSRAIRRDSTLHTSSAMANLRNNFSALAAHRRATRTRRLTLVDRLSTAGSSADGSQTSGESREEELRHALSAALGSLNALGNIYEQREARWRDEMKRVSDDRERVELLLTQALGPILTNGNGHNVEHPMTA